MAAAIRSKKSTQDERLPNVQPNHLPAGIRVVVKLAGQAIFAITAKQNSKLSPGGRITFRAAIKDGLQLGKANVTWMDVLSAIGFEVDGGEFRRAASGVHTSEKSGNPTVCHSIMVEFPNAETGKAEQYIAQAYMTWLVKKGCYNLSISAMPALVGTGTSGPQVTGDIEVFDDDNYVLVGREVANA